MAAIKVQFDPNYVPPDDSPLEWQQLIHKYQGQPGPPYPNNGGNAKVTADGAVGRDQTVQTIHSGTPVAGGRILFKPNSAGIDAAAKDDIQEIFEALRGRTNVLMIKGHASPDEIAARPDDPRGISLSYQRAVAVCDALEKLGIDPRVLRPVPCGTYEPAVTGVYGPEQQQFNRRVEVFATDTTAAQFNSVPTVSAAGTSDK
jgi:outer membrane protein OmpA-like peptidoglycan-associated protein